MIRLLNTIAKQYGFKMNFVDEMKIDQNDEKSLRYIGIIIMILIFGVVVSYISKKHMQKHLQPQPPRSQVQSQKIQKTLAITPATIPTTIPAATHSNTFIKPITKSVQFQSIVIQHSLVSTAEKAGLTNTMIKQLQTMFAGQINLSKNLHPGDRFNILYHEYFVNGIKNHPGHIIAAEIVEKNKDYRVIRFTNPKHQSHYYLPNGHATSAAYLKVPLNYKRISSGFTYRRFDPVLHEFRSHLGIDYAAPVGTPVKALGNGHVVFAGWMHGYGNAIIIRYGNIYKTLYGHLEKFSQNLRHSKYVKKGEVVGYVGETGWATGPHLHFEIYKNNVPINPKLVHLSHVSASVPFEYRTQFEAKAHQLFSEMTAFENAQ